MSEDDEILQAFLEESREGLDQLELDLVELETRPGDPELLAQIYRAIHSIKGTCGFLGYRRLEALTHRGEDVLDALRSGRLGLDAELATSLLGLIDAIRSFLTCIEATGDEGEDAHGDLLAVLTAHLESQPAPLQEGAVPSLAFPSPAASDSAHGAGESSIRVEVAMLDKLMDLAGELVLVRGKIGDLAVHEDGGALAPSYRDLRRVSTELLENVMQARLQPVGLVTRKVPRIARDLAASMNKLIRVELEGEDVGVDRAVNEALKDVLTHLVRNVVDHGIELPDERMAAGKEPEGTLRMGAWHKSGGVHLAISDDGRGIDPDRLASQAVSAGLLTRDAADALDVDQRLELIFLAGLSTKGEVTSVSGRGVGMDAVRANLDRIGASITVSSQPGRGTVFGIDVPLTLGIVPAVMVWSGGGRYCIPQVQVCEVVHLSPEEMMGSIDDIDGARVQRLRGELLPLVDLADQLGVTARAARADGTTVVVIEIDGKRFGLVVDELADTFEALVKPVPRSIRSVPIFAGVTVMSDGRPALILDAQALACTAGLATPRPAAPVQTSPAAPDAPPLLLATGPGGRRVAVPLSAVWRLEKFARDRVQRDWDTEVVQYGEDILPLLRLAQNGAGQDAGPVATASEHVDVIVCESTAGRIGLIVDTVEDVVAGQLVPLPLPGRPGVAGRVVLDERVAEVLDIEALVAGARAGP